MTNRDHITVWVVDMKRTYFMLQWIDPVTGKRRSESSKCTTKKKAERAAAEKEIELNSLVPRGDGLLSWDSFVEIFTNQHLASLEDSSANRFLGILSVFQRELDPKNLRSVTGSVLAQYASRLRDIGRSESTISTHMNHLKSALNWANSNGYLSEVPKMPRVAKGSRSRAKGRPLTNSEFVSILRAVKQTLIERMPLLLAKTPDQRRAAIRTWRRIIIGLWLSGLRLSEAMDLVWNEPESPISIITTEKRPLLSITAEGQKSKKNQLMPITPDFGRWLLRKTPEQLRQGFVFPLSKERHHDDRNLTHVSKVISAIGRASGVKVNADGKFASAHDLRRSFGLRWSSKLMPAELQQLMRHENVETTMRFYAVYSANDFAERLWENHSTPGSTHSANR